MTAKIDTLLPDRLRQYLNAVGYTPLLGVETLKGGAISRTVRILARGGQTFVAKLCAQAPDDLYKAEADGLEMLRRKGCPRVPQIIAYSADYLLMEDLGHSEHRNARYWEDLGRQLATLHHHKHNRFGYHLDNYLGLAVQKNGWHTDGYEFYIENRVMRYVAEGECPQVLTRDDRKSIESFCSKLRERVPDQAPSLCHGDLWMGNLVVTFDGSPAVVDPAVFYGWAEADLGMTTQYDRFDDRFYDAYSEWASLEPGWRERLEIYHIKEWLSMVAHFGAGRRSLARLREFLDRYA